MLKEFHHGCSEFFELLNIIDYKGKYVLVENIAFFNYENFLSWSANFMQYYILSQFLGNLFAFNNIVIAMKKDLVLNFRTTFLQRNLLVAMDLHRVRSSLSEFFVKGLFWKFLKTSKENSHCNVILLVNLHGLSKRKSNALFSVITRIPCKIV